MYRKTDPQQQWSVHAEFTISHPKIADSDSPPQAYTEQGDNGVRMTYTWTTQANQNSWSSRSSPPPSASTINPSNHGEASKCYGFQKGNLLFTSTPPRRPYTFGELATARSGVQDSGYGSDLLSPNSFNNCLPARRQVQPYNRKCRSTCNIVLSTNIEDENRTEDTTDTAHTQCGRTQSLRCQTPTLRCDRKDNFYGCGDPWCHHIYHEDEFSGRFSPVMETCEDCPSGQTSTKASRSNTFSTACTKNERKDACVQTFEMVDKCTSPFLKMGNIKAFDYANKAKKVYKKYGSNANRRKTEPIVQRSVSPSSIPGSLDSLKKSRRPVRSPNLGNITSSDKGSRLKSESKTNDLSKKPRTVHIDVYCTGTEMESDSSNSVVSTENETTSTPQTVFESDEVRITHKRGNTNEVPYSVGKSAMEEEKVVTNEGKQDDGESENEDEASTAYPSNLSSYSTIRDFSSSISSVPQSWTAYSLSSCTVPDDYDSVANTSWKDTFSDIESLLHSRSSIAQTDSLDFVPRKLFNKSASIDETPELRKDLLETPSQESLQPSDSFEYANSEDRMRIQQMEEFWKNKAQPLQWKSLQLERKHQLQQMKIKEYLEKRLTDKSFPKWESKESDSEGSEGSEKGWSFVDEDKKKKKNVTRTGFLNSGHTNCSNKSPSTVLFQEKFNMDPTLRAPFAIVPGIYTNPRAIAKKFGSIVSVVRKPGHHIGPVKNPDCLCDHCQRHFANNSYRGRARSLENPSVFIVDNWKNISRYLPTESASHKSVPSELGTDF